MKGESIRRRALFQGLLLAVTPVAGFSATSDNLSVVMTKPVFSLSRVRPAASLIWDIISALKFSSQLHHFSNYSDRFFHNFLIGKV